MSGYIQASGGIAVAQRWMGVGGKKLQIFISSNFGGNSFVANCHSVHIRDICNCCATCNRSADSLGQNGHDRCCKNMSPSLLEGLLAMPLNIGMQPRISWMQSARLDSSQELDGFHSFICTYLDESVEKEDVSTTRLQGTWT